MRYTNYPSPFLDVEGFGRFRFLTGPEEPDRACVYVVEQGRIKNLYSQPRMPSGRGIFPSGKANFRRNTLCIARKFNAAWRKKTRPDGV